MNRKRPEKKDLSGWTKGHGYGSDAHLLEVGRNNGIEEYEAFLPSEVELLSIVRKAFKRFKENKGKFNSYEHTVVDEIHNRLKEGE